LKRTSVNCGTPEEGAGVTEADKAGVVLAGEAAGVLALVGEETGGDSSCANEIEAMTRPNTTTSLVLIGLKENHREFTLAGQADRYFCATEIAVIVDLV
jgi:hypothetical protein